MKRRRDAATFISISSPVSFFFVLPSNGDLFISIDAPKFSVTGRHSLLKPTQRVSVWASLVVSFFLLLSKSNRETAPNHQPITTHHKMTISQNDTDLNPSKKNKWERSNVPEKQIKKIISRFSALEADRKGVAWPTRPSFAYS